MEPLKERFNQQLIGQLAQKIHAEYMDFSEKAFIDAIFDASWKEKELKQRMRHISHALHSHLPGDFTVNIKILNNIAPDFSDFTAMVFPDYVEVYGLEYRTLSLAALEHLTRFSSSEFAIRPYILQNPSETMKKMLEWSTHENLHVRRLASEGCRPRLPWATALPDFKKDPLPILPILENLRNDPSEYVRRSVANNLNDIAKDHPKLVLDVAKKWIGENKNVDKLVKHACRTLLKAGDKTAMNLFGFEGAEVVKLNDFTLVKDEVKMGNYLNFNIDLKLLKKGKKKVRVEYTIYYQKANGSLSGKIFKIAEKEIDHQKGCSYTRKHLFKDLTTRKHYLGKHEIGIVVNGEEIARKGFSLIE